MPAIVLDPVTVARALRDQVRADVASLSERLELVGFLAEGHAPSATYAEYTRRGCEDVGIGFSLRIVRPERAEAEVRAASADPGVHGIIVYYPIADLEQDGWLREIVDPRKDIEGLHSFWGRSLYENRRFLDDKRLNKAILPCTPLAILKLLDAARASDVGNEKPLAGRRVCIFNRSEVVGRPLAAMMANDGAEVVSFDVDGPLLFVPGEFRGAYEMRHTNITRAEALAQSDIVVTGVPNRAFPLIRGSEIKEGAVCLNFSTFKNYDDDIQERASVFVPRVGPMTVTIALRNTVRLFRIAHRQA